MTKGTYAPGAFTALSTGAVTCGTVNQFIVIGLRSDRFAVQWCAIGDPTDWPTPATDDARSKQSGKQVLPSKFGYVTGIAGNDFFGYIFQERAITKMTYVGGDVVFNFDVFEEGRGCFELNRYEKVDDLVFFESEYGYHALQNDQIADIGHGIVDDSYPPQSTSDQSNVCVNEAIRCVFFESQNLCYNYKTQQWTRLPALDGYSYFSVNGETDVVGRTVVLGTLGGLTSSAGGAAQDATIVTGATDPNQFGHTVVNGVRPRVVGDSTTEIQVGTQNQIDDSVTWYTGTAINSRTGYSDLRAEGRYIRVQQKHTGGFTTAHGADIDFAPQGKV